MIYRGLAHIQRDPVVTDVGRGSPVVPYTTLAQSEVRLYEGQPARLDFVYGHLDHGSATVGVQKTQDHYTRYLRNTGGPTEGLPLGYNLEPCGTPTDTPTPRSTGPTHPPVPPRSTL